MFNGVSSLPTRYFTDEKLSVHTAQTGKDLSARLSAGFNPEILRFKAERKTGSVPKKTLHQQRRRESWCTIGWSGPAAPTPAKSPAGCSSDSTFSSARESSYREKSRSYCRKYTAGQNVPVEKIAKFSGSDPAGTAETEIYTGMLNAAFAEFGDKHYEKWFAAPADK